jgi:tetratricopeptide (TPR) repeat protein
LSLADRIIVFRERIDQQVRKDQAQELKLKSTLDRCLEQLSKQERGKILVTISQKTEKVSIEQRITFYTQLIQQFAQKIPSIREEEVTRLFELAEKSYQQKNYKEAMGLLDQLFKFDKQHLDGHRLRANLFKEMGNKVAFMCELRMIVKIDFAEARDFYYLAEILEEGGQLEEAFQFYEEAVAKDPSIRNLEKVGDLSSQMRRWFRAIQVYQQILKQSPYLGRVMHKYGRALLENNREEEAFNVLRQAIEIKDDNALSRVCVGRIYRKQSAFHDAVESFQRAVELDDTNVEAYYWWGSMLMDRGEFDEALQRATRAVELDPGRTRNRLLLGRALGNIGRFEKALETLEPCLSASPPSVDVLLTYSEMCRNANRAESAIEVLGAFVKRFPHQPQIRAEYGVLLVQAGRLEEARTYLQPPGAVRTLKSA